MIRSCTSPRPNPGDEDCPIACDVACEHGRFIAPYVARRLQARTLTEFELHLFACEHCSRAVEFELFVKRTISDFAKFAQFSRSWH
jgi:hypothetical protein